MTASKSPPPTDEARISCPACKTENPVSLEACASCGAKLKKESPDVGQWVVGGLSLLAAGAAIWKGIQEAKQNAPQAKPAPLVQPPKPTPAPVSQSVKPARPRPARGEKVSGWVTGGITSRKLPRRVIDPGGEIEDFQVTTAPPIMVGGIPIYEKPNVRYSQPKYAPPTAKLVFALLEYPSGDIAQWDGGLNWENVDILHQSQEYEDNNPSGEPLESPQIKAMVEELSRTLIRDGWEPCGKGVAWCNLKFRKKYAQVGAPLKWK